MGVLIFFFLLQVNVFPQNAALDRYTVIPPLGHVKSIAASNMQVFALSDDYLLFIDKHDFRLNNALYFDCAPQLVGYDHYTSDLWILCREKILRFRTMTFNLQEFPLHFPAERFAIDAGELYLEDARNGDKFALDKVTGMISRISAFPVNIYWHRKTIEGDITKHPFLNPYYFVDDVHFSQTPFVQYPITAVYDDGMHLFVGTDQYGVLKYNKISWQNERIVNGPLDLNISRNRMIEGKIAFVSRSGLSYFDPETGDWTYQRFRSPLIDLVTFNGAVHVARQNSVLVTEGTLESPRGSFDENILSISSDDENIYVGTRSGAFSIAGGTDSPAPFGPDRHAVHIIYPARHVVYVGGEMGMYGYDREAKTWSTLLPFGVKDIVELADDIYALGTNNQLIRYPGADRDTDTVRPDTNWSLLPYFNIYDIDTDGTVLYCATYSGMYYYEPVGGSYHIIYNLPRMNFKQVFVAGGMLLAKSTDLVFSLPLEYRD
ncbi:hypothetical protein IBX73_02150 [candidate division WOR-3 bacterium]|nr:hypothetical protein [candidate division WOR-3 bacterium]